jgi:hypothetical protein
MPKTGGFGDPLIFMAVMGVLAGIVRAILGLFHFGAAVSAVMAIASVILVPIMVVIFGFIGAAIVFIIWKLMGSQESYETAYRCAAYAMAISPITALCDAIPYVGGLVGIAWMTFLLVTASVEVHKIVAKTAWLVFGIIGAILALLSISSQLAARRLAKSMQNWERDFGGTSGKDMTPEEAGQAAAAFMKGLGVDTKAIQKAQRKAQKEAEAAEAETEKDADSKSEE